MAETSAGARLLNAQTAAKTVGKQGENKSQGYKYARAEDVIAEAHRALHEAGLTGVISFDDIETRAVQSSSGTNGLFVTLKSSLVVADDKGEVATIATGYGTGIDYPGDKAVYKAMTGAAKYAYASALGIPFGDDPEDEATAKPEANEGAGRRKGFSPGGKQEKMLRDLVNKAGGDANLIAGYLAANFTSARGDGISDAINFLKRDPEAAVEGLTQHANAWTATQSDVPADDTDLPPAEPEDTQGELTI